MGLSFVSMVASWPNTWEREQVIFYCCVTALERAFPALTRFFVRAGNERILSGCYNTASPRYSFICRAFCASLVTIGRTPISCRTMSEIEFNVRRWIFHFLARCQSARKQEVFRSGRYMIRHFQVTVNYFGNFIDSKTLNLVRFFCSKSAT